MLTFWKHPTPQNWNMAVLIRQLFYEVLLLVTGECGDNCT